MRTRARPDGDPHRCDSASSQRSPLLLPGYSSPRPPRSRARPSPSRPVPSTVPGGCTGSSSAATTAPSGRRRSRRRCSTWRPSPAGSPRRSEVVASRRSRSGSRGPTDTSTSSARWTRIPPERCHPLSNRRRHAMWSAIRPARGILAPPWWCRPCSPPSASCMRSRGSSSCRRTIPGWASSPTSSAGCLEPSKSGLTRAKATRKGSRARRTSWTATRCSS